MSNVNHQKNIIEIKDLSFSYDQNEVLHNVNLNVHQGDYLGLVGPNGAGKTTLLKIMLGLLQPTQGSIKLFGTSRQDFREYRRLAYVPQQATNFDVNFPATVYEVVAMGRYSHRGLGRRLQNVDREIIYQSLERVGMREKERVLIGDLSGGQKQRVFIARALAGQPEIMFLDEPTTGIDAKSRDEFYALLREFNKSLDLTLVLVTHDIERITKEAMHIACLDHTLVCHNSPADFLRDSKSLHALEQDIKIIHHHHNQQS